MKGCLTETTTCVVAKPLVKDKSKINSSSVQRRGGWRGPAGGGRAAGGLSPVKLLNGLS